MVQRQFVLRSSLVRGIFVTALLSAGSLFVAPALSAISESGSEEHPARAAQGPESGSHDEHASATPSANPIALDPDLAIVTFVIFLVLLAVLAKFAWKPISEAVDRREKSIADSIEAARRTNEEAHHLLAEHRKQLAGAAEEIRRMLEKARRDADVQKTQILADAHSAAQAEKQRALREIDAATKAALEHLAQASVETAVQLATKIVSQKLSDTERRQLIHEALERLPSHN